jgi:hypothetical protein
MANLQDLGDEEFMDAWTSAAQELEDAKQRVKEFSAEHQRRVAAEADEYAANHELSELDQTVGSV